jgi:hypothetical protein
VKPRERQTPPVEGLTVGSGDAAWKEHRDAVAKRNSETKKRATAERESRKGIAGARAREAAKTESDQLAELNSQIEKRRRSGR